MRKRYKRLFLLVLTVYLVSGIISPFLKSANLVDAPIVVTLSKLAEQEPRIEATTARVPMSIQYPAWRWVPLDDYHLQFYSSYLDNRIRDKVVVRTLVYKTYTVQHQASCTVKTATNEYQGSGKFDLIAMGSPKCPSTGGCKWRYEAHHFLCTLDSHAKVDNGASIQIQLKQGASANGSHAQISPPIPIYIPPVGARHAHYLTMCPPPLQNKFSDWFRLITYVELHKYLGASHFIFYNHSISEPVNHVLQHYVRTGLAQIVQWTSINVTQPPPPFFQHFESISYKGQMLAMNDCYFKSLGISKFVASTDVDEFLWVEGIKRNALVQYLQKVDRADAGVFQLSSTFADARWNHMDSFAQFNSKKHNVEMFGPFYHYKIYNPPIRSKMIVKPEAADKITVHNPFKLMHDYRTVRSNTSLILIYHLSERMGQVLVNPYEAIATEIMLAITNTIENIKATSKLTQ